MKRTDDKILFIHMLRGVSVLIVLYCHLGEMFWLDQTTCSQIGFFEPNNFSRIPVWASIGSRIEKTGINFGMLGVAIFFLISGFLIPASIKKYGCKDFLKGRIIRLYPMYAVVLLITCLVLWRSAIFSDIPPEIWTNTLNLGNYFKNLSLFRDWFWVGTLDAVNWTMECDMKFYLLCTYIAWVASIENEKVIISIMGAGTLVNYLVCGILDDLRVTLFYLYKFFYIIGISMPYLCIMFIGVSFYYYYKKVWDKKKFLGTVLSFGIMMILNFKWSQPNAMLSYCISYGTAILIFTCAFIKREKVPNIKFIRFCAEISFPLYLIHGATGYALMNYLFKIQNNVYLAFIETIAIVFAAATFLHYRVEIPLRQIKFTNKNTIKHSEVG